ncbi:hypothetical protein EB118_11085 [bacterium]|nr:hypothetical protein [bacterium]
MEKSHAQLINEQYLKSDSHFVSLRERLNEALANTPLFEGLLIAMVQEFKRRHKDWQSFIDLHLCQAIQVTMDRILIDTTMQRSLNLRHILNILQHFRSTMVMAIQVYEDESKPGYYIAWDGQHTAITLYIILTKVFGEQVAKALVPVVVYNVKHKLEIRRNFILLNGDAKEELDFIDKYKQMVCGVKIDHADDPEWVDTAIKNDYLANAGLFATHSKFGDDDKPGAFSLLADTLMSKSLKTRKHPEVTRMFARYWTFLNEQRPVEPKEARQLYEYFNLCHEQGITVDDAYLLEFVQFTKDNFEADFGPTGPFWDKVKMAYENWYKKANPESYAEFGLKGFTSEMRTGIPFLIAQIQKSTKLKTPKYSANNGFTVDKKDLW